jgi:hypothetical protein
MPSDVAEIVEGELVPLDDDSKPARLNLFGSDDPDVVIAQAAKVARALEQVIRQQKLYVTIRGKDHVRVEGWTLLGTMLGVFPITVWSRPVEGGWEARVEARTMAGAVVGAAESECLRSETRWRNADDYAVRSMAATRATSKALRQPLGFVMPLAGFQETPAEEIPFDEPRAEAKPPSSPVAPVQAKPEQLDEIKQLIQRLTELRPEADWKQRAREITGGPPELMTVTIANVLIGKLQQSVEAAEQFGPAAEEGSR